MGVTTILTISTLIQGLKSTLPKVAYLTALDIYLWVCFFFVFAATCEYCLLNYWMTQHESPQAAIQQLAQNTSIGTGHSKSRRLKRKINAGKDSSDEEADDVIKNDEIKSYEIRNDGIERNGEVENEGAANEYSNPYGYVNIRKNFNLTAQDEENGGYSDPITPRPKNSFLQSQLPNHSIPLLTKSHSSNQFNSNTQNQTNNNQIRLRMNPTENFQKLPQTYNNSKNNNNNTIPNSNSHNSNFVNIHKSSSDHIANHTVNRSTSVISSTSKNLLARHRRVVIPNNHDQTTFHTASSSNDNNNSRRSSVFYSSFEGLFQAPKFGNSIKAAREKNIRCISQHLFPKIILI